MLTAEQRYTTDPVFHTLVDKLLETIVAGQFTPSELRDAVILAATKYEMSHTPAALLFRGRGPTVHEPDRGY